MNDLRAIHYIEQIDALVEQRLEIERTYLKKLNKIDRVEFFVWGALVGFSGSFCLFFLSKLW